MGWRVETLNKTVDAELEDLSADMRAKFVHIAELIETFGPLQVGMPYVKPLGRKLFEMRMQGSAGIARALYVPASGQRLIVVHVFVKKTRKTPERYLRIALQRAKEVR